MRRSLNGEPVADSKETSESVPSPTLCSASRSIVVEETADSSETVSVPVPPSRPSSPPCPLTTSLPPRPRMAFAAPSPESVSATEPPVRPSSPSRVSVPAPMVSWVTWSSDTVTAAEDEA